MGLSLLRYSEPSAEPRWGVLRGDRVFPLALDAGHHREVMSCFFTDRSGFDAATAITGVEMGGLTLHSPLSGNIQLFAQGLNYADHRAESGASVDAGDEENLLFLKAGSSICGPNDRIVRPAGCELLDYECELGLVLKTTMNQAATVTDANLGDYVGGLVLCNDVSARDFMFGAPMLQWYKGKSQRTFCPAGPVLYLLEEGDLQQLYALELKLWMNGELKQHALTDQLIHRPPATLTELSGFTRVDAGDCLLTGTPGGVLAGHSLKAALSVLLNFTNDRKRREKFVAAQKAQAKFLEPGDVLELEITSLDGSISLGRQRNEIADADSG